MTQITAKQVRSAAASVRGARSTGVETEAARQAPVLLADARRVLGRLAERYDAAGMADTGDQRRIAGQLDAMEEAVRELADELGEEPQKEGPPTHQSADVAAPEPEPGTGIDADEFSAAVAADSCTYYDGRGMRVARVRRSKLHADRFSSLGGHVPASSGPERTIWLAEDGREVSAQEYFVRVDDRGIVDEWSPGRGRGPSATSEYLPQQCRAVSRKLHPVWTDNPTQNAQTFESLAAERAERRKAEREANQPADESPQNNPFAHLVRCKTRRHHEHHQSHSTRRHTRADRGRRHRAE